MGERILCMCPICHKAHFESILSSEAKTLQPYFWYAGNVPVYHRECEDHRVYEVQEDDE